MLRTKEKGRAVLRFLLALAVAATLRPALALAGEESASLEPEQVRVIQRALNDRGQKVKVTGAWDRQTRYALGVFQAKYGLDPTGRLDEATSRALGVDPEQVMPVGGRLGPIPDPARDCQTNNTVDCLPGA